MADDAYRDGGPAYPQPQVSDGLGGIEYTEVEGMSLRDWFAGQALANVPGPYATGDGLPRSRSPQHVATDAYAVADAMLKARETD